MTARDCASDLPTRRLQALSRSVTRCSVGDSRAAMPADRKRDRDDGAWEAENRDSDSPKSA